MANLSHNKDEAYKKGLLDDKEYKKARKELIEKHTD